MFVLLARVRMGVPAWAIARVRVQGGGEAIKDSLDDPVRDDHPSI